MSGPVVSMFFVHLTDMKKSAERSGCYPENKLKCIGGFAGHLPHGVF